MPDFAHPDALVETAFGLYAEPLLRDVATKLVKPRSPIPADELVDKCLQTLGNPPVIDRRIRDLSDNARSLLVGIGASRRNVWQVGHLLALQSTIAESTGTSTLNELLQSGLLSPMLIEGMEPIADFQLWYVSQHLLLAPVVCHSGVSGRALAMGMPRGVAIHLGLALKPADLGTPLGELDGFDWPLRIAVVWQQVLELPMKLTQGNLLFKRDLTRLQDDDKRLSSSADQLATLPDASVLALHWAGAAHLLERRGVELFAAPFPSEWDASRDDVLRELWAGLSAVEAWDPKKGYHPMEPGESSFPSIVVVVMLILAQAEHPQAWHRLDTIAAWLWEHHPSWSGLLSSANAGNDWLATLTLSLLHPLRLVEVQRGENHGVRLSDLGRHLLQAASLPATSPSFPQTLLVQPNGEILLYRQGLTPSLIAKLSRFARWQGIGPACTLELNATQTYHGLESGLSLAGITQTLNQHGMKPIPAPVLDLLSRWASKRDRLTIFGSATLVEFPTPKDLDEAISRGLVSIRVTDRIGLTDDGRDPDPKQLRQIGNRDYSAKPQECLSVADNGVTLTINSALSDLLLEAEIVQIAEALPSDPNQPRQYQLTPESLQKATDGGMTVDHLDRWFVIRSGEPLSAAGRMLLQRGSIASPNVVSFLVLQVESEEVADGLLQWPETARYLGDRLGPKAIILDRKSIDPLREMLAKIGIKMVLSDSASR